MKTKELKVQVPEDYEIDKENSTFERIRFKPIKKDITYDDVCNMLFKNDTGYFIDQYGKINFYNIGTNRFDANNAPNGRQLKKLLALNQLLNIAEYYNKKHPQSDAYPYYITFDSEYGYIIMQHHFLDNSYGVVASFNNKDDTQAVIDNPNFREILDTIYKD